MVKGLDTFRKYFESYENQYVLIGGAACDIIFESNDTIFRATTITCPFCNFGIMAWLEGEIDENGAPVKKVSIANLLNNAISLQ